MPRKKNEEFSEANIPKSLERRSSRNGSTSTTPNWKILSNGQISRTGSPGCPSVTSSGGRRSITSTPESSLTQRELKKLEDYWTKNNPVKEDSPRLRSNRKATFNLRECFGENSNAKTFQKDEVKLLHLKKAEQSLPESPIPGTVTQGNSDIDSSKKSLILENRDNKTTTVPSKRTDKHFSSPSIITNKPECSDKQKQAVSTTCATRTSLADLEPSLDNRNTCNKYNYADLKAEKQDATIQKGEIVTGATSDLESSDSDDDDYIPPRKKLRSEVSEDELWDGIPLTISFKRLAPIPKPSSVISQNKPENVNEHKDISSGSKENADESVVKLVDFQNFTGKANTESQNEQKRMIKRVPCDREPDNAKLNGTNSERKRRTRLKEKLVTSPVKTETFNENITSKHSTPVNEAPFDESFKLDQYSNLRSQNDDSNGDVETKKVDITEDKVSDDCPGERLLKLTLSQILSVDNKKDTSNAEVPIKESIVTEEKTKHGDELNNEDSPVTNATVSISKTINDIFEEISGPQTSRSKEDAGIDNTVENDSRITRRSRRLSGIKLSKLSQNSPDMSTSKNEYEILPVGLATDSESYFAGQLNNISEDSESKAKDVNLSLSKHNLFTRNTNKCAKSVPPLRIKLKQPAKGNSKNKCVPKSKTSALSTNGKTSKTNKSTTELRIQDSVKKTSSVDKKEQPNNPKDSAEPGTSDKESFTPKSKKKKTQGQRKWSPPSSTIALRLNNERRLSAAGCMLSNPLLNNHACVLWSSENRRHVQLSNPHATASELDTKLSRKWDSLSDKEKLKYFQRARDAIKDENRHSSRKTNVLNEPNNAVDTVKTYTEECSVENFQKLAPASQMTEIKKWLNFYNEISPDTCSQVITSFKEALVEENRNKARKEQEQEKTRVKSKKNKQKKKEERVTPTDSNTNYRKLLYEKIQDQKEKVKDIINEKKKEQYKSVLDNYSSMVKRMVFGDAVHFAGDVRSDKLTETLCELRMLEKDKKLAVTGNVCKDKEYEDIFARLCKRNSPDGRTLVCALENVDIDAAELENTCKKITNFPTLSPNSLANSLPEIRTPEKSEENLLSPLRIGRSNRTSPVTVLTEMVAEDLLANQPQIGFRNAISLLSNKVVPSPTLILPPKGSNSGRTSANKNQNCNVVFTKLQKSTPSVLTTNFK